MEWTEEKKSATESTKKSLTTKKSPRPKKSTKNPSRTTAQTRIHRAQRPGCQISTRCHLQSVVEKIGKGLDVDNVIKFRNSCFGAFLELGSMKFQGQLVAKMLESLKPGTSEKRSLSFKLKDNEYELGPSQYYLLTGLRFNGWHKPKNYSNFHTNVFNGQERLHFCDVEAKFDEFVLEYGGKGELCLKLSFLLVLYGILLSREKDGKRLELEYMHLLDDLESFNSFPWGLISYELLVNFCHNARVRIEVARINRKPTFADSYGFVYVIQLFAYEVFSGIGEKCAKKRPHMMMCTPRMVHWDVLPSRVNYIDVVEMLDADGTEAPMLPTTGENLRLQEEGPDQTYECCDEVVSMVLNMVPGQEYSFRKRKAVCYEESGDDIEDVRTIGARRKGFGARSTDGGASTSDATPSRIGKACMERNKEARHTLEALSLAADVAFVGVRATDAEVEGHGTPVDKFLHSSREPVGGEVEVGLEGFGSQHEEGRGLPSVGVVNREEQGDADHVEAGTLRSAKRKKMAGQAAPESRPAHSREPTTT